MEINLLANHLKNKKGLSDIEFRRIQLIQAANLISIGSCLLLIISYASINLKQLLTNIIILIITSLVLTYNFFLINKGKTIVTKYILFIWLSVTLLFSLFINIGAQLNLQIFFLLYAILPILMFHRKKYFILSYFIVNCACFIYMHYFFPKHIPIYQFPEEIAQVFKISVLLTSLIILANFIRLHQSYREKIENTLNTQTTELNKLNILKDKLLSIIAHDLRNSFNTIINSFDLISSERKSMTEQKKKKIISGATENAKAAYNLLENLLVWSKMQKENMHIHPEKLNLTQLIEECVYLYQEAMAQKEIQLVKKINDESFVFTDRNLILIIFRNILSNAVKFTPRGGNITITESFTEDNYTTINFTDSGVGMQKQTIQKLLCENCIDTTKGTNNEKGSGIGLSLCMESVKKISGTINIQSEPNKGSTFIIGIPNLS